MGSILSRLKLRSRTIDAGAVILAHVGEKSLLVGPTSYLSCAGLTRASILFAARWIAGSSPAMTAEGIEPALAIGGGAGDRAVRIEVRVGARPACPALRYGPGLGRLGLLLADLSHL